MKLMLSHKKIIIGAAILGMLLCGCGAVTVTEAATTEDDLATQVSELTQKVDKLQKTIDSYYGTTDIDDIAKSNVTQDQISYETTVLSDQLFLTLFNNGEEPVSSIDIQAVYYDESGNMLGLSTGYVYDVFPNVSIAVGLELPKDNEGNVLTYNSVEIGMDISESAFLGESKMDQIEFSDNIGSNGQVLIKVVNNGNDEVETANLEVIYYAEGEPVGVATTTLWNLKPGKEQIQSIYRPTDWYGNDLYYDDYEVLVTAAYNMDEIIQTGESDE